MKQYHSISSQIIARAIDYTNVNISTVNRLMIERVTEYKYLCIWIDDELSLKCHIDTLVCRLKQKVGYFYRNNTIFPTFCRKRVAEAIFMSVLDHSDVIYRHASSSALKLLDSVYNSALRFITGDVFGTHHCILCDRRVLSPREN